MGTWLRSVFGKVAGANEGSYGQGAAPYTQDENIEAYKRWAAEASQQGPLVIIATNTESQTVNVVVWDKGHFSRVLTHDINSRISSVLKQPVTNKGKALILSWHARNEDERGECYSYTQATIHDFQGDFREVEALMKRYILPKVVLTADAWAKEQEFQIVRATIGHRWHFSPAQTEDPRLSAPVC